MKFYRTFLFNLLAWVLVLFTLVLCGCFYAIRIDVQSAYRQFAEDRFNQSFERVEHHFHQLQGEAPFDFEAASPSSRESWIQDFVSKIVASEEIDGKSSSKILLHSPQPPYQTADGWVFEKELGAFASTKVVYQETLRFEHFEQIRLQGRHLILILLGAAGVLVSLLLIFAARYLTKPLGILMAGSQRVSKGDFNFTLPVQKKDEIGLLTESFNQMVRDLALKDKYRALLDQVSDEAVAQKLIEGRISLRGEKRKATVLFCDIRGFTHLSESMDPQELIAILNQHMAALAEIAHLHHGVVDKFIGDALMVIFGSPATYGDDALNAILAASQMMEKRKELNLNAVHPLEIGIGIATGFVVAGCLGSEKRLNYTVIGDVVNRASRLCGKADPSQILLDAITDGEVKDKCQTQFIGEWMLKGIDHAVAVFEFLNKK